MAPIANWKILPVDKVTQVQSLAGVPSLFLLFSGGSVFLFDTDTGTVEKIITVSSL